MKKFVLKVVSIALAIISLCTVFSMMACNEKESIYEDGDFSLVITLNKTNDVVIGETIKVVAVLKNLSDKDICIEGFGNKIEDTISIYMTNAVLEGEQHVPNNLEIKKNKFVLKKGETIFKVKDCVISETNGPVECFASCSFYGNNNAKDTMIKSQVVKMTFIGE